MSSINHSRRSSSDGAYDEEAYRSGSRQSRTPRAPCLRQLKTPNQFLLNFCAKNLVEKHLEHLESPQLLSAIGMISLRRFGRSKSRYITAFEDIVPADLESICSRRGNFPGRDFGGVAPDLRLVLPAIQLHFGQDTGSKKRKLLRARSAARSGG